MSKKDAAVYLMAAELMANGEACTTDCAWPCCALSRALPTSFDAEWRRLRSNFVDVFVDAKWSGSNASRKDKNLATIALCFAAAMAETNDL